MIATAPTRKRRPMPKNDAEWRTLLMLLPGYDPFKDAGDSVFNVERATRVIDFFEKYLTHTKGGLAKGPIKNRAFLLEDWQRSFIANLFGWVMPDGFRRYKEVLLYVPKKNGKSPLGAGIGIYLTVADGEQGAEVYSVASDRDQASIVSGYASGMVENSPALSKRLRVYKNRSMVHEESKSSYKTLPADAAGSHGLQIHGVLIDELHTQPNSELVHSLTSGTAARDQAVVVYMTTADYDGESVCNDKLKYAEGVRDGLIPDNRFLPAIWKASRDDDWADPKVWARVNPNLGVSVKMDYFVRACQQAKDDPTYENEFKRLHLNMPTEQAVRAIPMVKWDACAGDLPDETTLKALPCYLALDLSSTVDITALCMAWRLDNGEDDTSNAEFAIKWWFFVPGETMDKKGHDDHAPYPTWANQGHIERTDTASVNYARIREMIQSLASVYSVQEICLDPWNATHLSQQLEEEDGFTISHFRQGFKSMSPAYKLFYAAMVDGRIKHGGNPVARWMASNVATETDPADNIKMTKRRSFGRIDGIVAMVMAMQRASLGGDPDSVYEKRGIRIL